MIISEMKSGFYWIKVAAKDVWTVREYNYKNCTFVVGGATIPMRDVNQIDINRISRSEGNSFWDK